MPGAAAAVAPPTFTTCSDPGWECGSFTVPLVADDPTRTETIDLEVRRRPATVQPSLGPLVINTGGPGAPSADSAAWLASRIPAEVRDRFDLVVMDPRATLHSSATACPKNPPALEGALFSQPNPADTAAMTNWLQLMTAANSACVTEIDADVAQYGTWQSAGDIDALRAALGADMISYLGYSYGTRLGAVYAERFPARVRAMVLDSAVNPSGGNAAFGKGKAVAFDTIIQRWAQWCDQQSDVAPGCGTPGALAAYDAAIAAMPLADPVLGATWNATSVEANVTAILSQGVSKAKWSALAPALQAMGSGDAGRMRVLLGLQPAAASVASDRPVGVPGDITDALTATNCADMSDRPDAVAVAALMAGAQAANQRAGAYGAALAAGCAGWPVGAKPVDTISANPAATVVVIVRVGILWWTSPGVRRWRLPRTVSSWPTAASVMRSATSTARRVSTRSSAPTCSIR